MNIEDQKLEAVKAANDAIQSLWTSVYKLQIAVDRMKEVAKVEPKYGNTTIEKEFVKPYENMISVLKNFVDPDGEFNS